MKPNNFQDPPVELIVEVVGRRLEALEAEYREKWASLLDAINKDFPGILEEYRKGVVKRSSERIHIQLYEVRKHGDLQLIKDINEVIDSIKANAREIGQMDAFNEGIAMAEIKTAMQDPDYKATE